MLYSNINYYNPNSCSVANRWAFERNWTHPASLGFRQKRMKNSQPAMDKAAIGLSLVCLAHCLLSLMPLLILPSLGAAFLEDERFHYGILFLVLPTSLLALVMGFRKHGQYSVPIIGVSGLCVLLLVALLGEETTGDIGEIAITVAGSLIVAYAHARNLLLGHSGDFRPIAGSD